MEKNFNLMYNVGSAKYVINFHDGESTHKDGSPFYGIMLFNNRVKANKAVRELLAKGYKQTSTPGFFQTVKR